MHFKEEFDVHCVLTKSGREFVTPSALCAISHNPVLDNDWFSTPKSPGVLAHPDYEHLFWAEHADVLLVAPASADSIARLVQGRANGLLKQQFCDTKPVLIAPAMNTAMLNATATQENITILQRRNMTVLLPNQVRLRVVLLEQDDSFLLKRLPCLLVVP